MKANSNDNVISKTTKAVGITIAPVDAVAETDEYIEPGQEVLEQAKRGEITSKESAEIFTDLVGFCGAQLKKQEDKRVSLVKPLNDHVKFINLEFKKTKAAFEEADEIGRKKLKVYLDSIAAQELAEQKRLREEEENRILQEATEQQEESEKLMDSGNEAEAQAMAEKSEETFKSASNIITAPKTTTLRGNTGKTAGRRKKTTAVVTDIVAAAEAHPELFELKATLAKQMLAGGIKLTGIELEEESTVCVR